MTLLRSCKILGRKPIFGNVIGKKKVTIKHIFLFNTVWQSFPRFLVVSIMKMLLEMELMVF